MTTPPPLIQPPPGPMDGPMDGPKKTPVWVWIVAAVGGMVVLAMIGVGLLAYYAVQKVKEVASNPAAAAAMIAKIDPDLEVLEVDEDKKVIRVRNRKNNEEVTVNLNDILQGKIKLSHEGKDGVETFEVGGKAKMPSWLPVYPGVEMTSIGAGRSDEKGGGGAGTFETADTPEQIVAFYRAGMEKQGFTMAEKVQTLAAMVLIMKAETGDMATITATPGDGKTRVTVLYANK